TDVASARAALSRGLLLEQSPFLVIAAVRAPLNRLRAGRGAAVRIVHYQAAVPVDEGVTSVAVQDRFPLVVLSRTEGPLDDSGAGRCGGALDDSVLTALDAVDLIIAAVRRDEFPAQVVARGGRRPLRDLRTVRQRTLLIQHEAAGDVLNLVDRSRVNAAATDGRRGSLGEGRRDPRTLDVVRGRAVNGATAIDTPVNVVLDRAAPRGAAKDLRAVLQRLLHAIVPDLDRALSGVGGHMDFEHEIEPRVERHGAVPDDRAGFTGGLVTFEDQFSVLNIQNNRLVGVAAALELHDRVPRRRHRTIVAGAPADVIRSAVLEGIRGGRGVELGAFAVLRGAI